MSNETIVDGSIVHHRDSERHGAGDGRELKIFHQFSVYWVNSESDVVTVVDVHLGTI